MLKNSIIFGICGAREAGPPASSARSVLGLGLLSEEGLVRGGLFVLGRAVKNRAGGDNYLPTAASMCRVGFVTYFM